MGACPKCGKAVEATARICPACGVIMSKVRSKTSDSAPPSDTQNPRVARPLPSSLRLPPPMRSVRPDSQAGATPQSHAGAEPRHTSGGAALAKVGVAAVIAIVALAALNRENPTPPSVTPPPRAAVRTPPQAALPADATLGNLTPDDIKFLNAVSGRLQQNPTAVATAEETERLERLVAENSGLAPVKSLLMAVYLRSASRDLEMGSFASIDLALGRMKLLDDQDAEVHAFEAHVRVRQQDWAAAVAAAQRYEEALGPATVKMSVTLAVALEKSGRRADAQAILGRPVFDACARPSGDDVNACLTAADMRRMMSAPAVAANVAPEPETRTRAALSVDPAKEQIQSERFDIRFDGESQTGVARDVRFVLDRAYVRLADIYYERPARKIPVVLHSQLDYFTATGAPWWSGGVYSSHNGSIQIPIRGLPSTLPREMEDVLVHELSHAFVDEMSGGRAGRMLQEGLAQYMEGKRIEQELSPAELKRLATSGRQSVMSFYMLSLAVTQHLVQARGQGKINDLLKAIKETGSEDGGYRQVFGQPAAVVQRDILETFWRRYS